MPSPAVRKRIYETDKELMRAIDGNPVLQEKVKLLRSTPGVGPTDDRGIVHSIARIRDTQ
jgi:hypothetical protein